jgi:hypothetical protein
MRFDELSMAKRNVAAEMVETEILPAIAIG